MKINEVFKSIQGEGKSAGEQRLFIRFSGCTLRCSFCDTPYHTKNRELNAGEKRALSKNYTWCITGGEPLLHSKDIINLIEKYRPYFIEVETNGTILPSEELISRIDQFNVSPKEQRFQPKNSRSTEPIILEELYAGKATVKFVYSDKKSEKFIEKTIKKYKIPNRIVWIMPEGKTKKEQEKNSLAVWDYCIKKGYNFSPRLHVNLFNTKKGV